MRVNAVIDEAMQTGRSSYGAYFQLRRRNGHRQWTHVRGRILRDERGSAYRVLGIVRNASTELTEFTLISPLEAGRRRITGMVQGTTEALSKAVTVEDVAAVLTGTDGMERFGADGLVLGLVEGGALKVIATAGDSMDALDELKLHRLDDSLPLAEAVLTGRSRFVTSLGELGHTFPRLAPFIQHLELDAAAFLPLIAQARPVGGLALFFRGRSDFSAEDRNLCLGLAGILAQSLQRAILFDQEREFATGLQASMLPRHVPEVPGAEIAVRYHAAWGGREVGGDWYDVIALPRGRVGVVVGDVQGHDTHAAAIMGQLRIAIRAYAGRGTRPRPCSPAPRASWPSSTPNASRPVRTPRWTSPPAVYGPSGRATWGRSSGTPTAGWAAPNCAADSRSGSPPSSRTRSSPRPGWTWCPARRW